MLLQEITLQAERDPGRLALQGMASQLTYGELVSEVSALTTALTTLVEPASIALAMDNSPAWIVLDLAVLVAGWTNVPIPAFFSASQKQHAIQDAGVSLLLTDASDAWLQLYPACESLASWTVAGKAVSVMRLNSQDRASGAQKITYTSGTTGAPKGVSLTAQTMWQVADSIRLLTQPDHADRHFCVLPLATLLENVAGVYASLISGATVVVYPCQEVGFSGSQFEISRLYQGLANS